MSASQEKLSNAKELAARLGVSVPFVRKQTLAGMPHYQVGRCVRFDPTQVLAWFAERAKTKQ